MMESNCSDKNNIDTVKIMTQIKENVRRKKEAGIYSDEDVEELSNLSLEIPSAIALSGNALLDQIAFLQRNYDFRADYSISSHRPFLGKIIVPVKKFFIRAFLKLESPILDKSVSYNFHLVQTLNYLVEEIESLKKECAELKQQSKSSKHS